MPDALLLAVFATHLPFFVWRYRATGELRHAATSLTFVLLATAYALRLFAPEFEIAGVGVPGTVRRIALLAACVSVSMLLHRFWQKYRPA